ncbi:type I methionyl aminopeptidase [Caenispirillum bisanense]|uniref:Methionine aminopeptidase n=1 Tax=Caenispirillum bisanense TaxID=414052 RepID=A0A286GG81_9PROT|nr:type I methionyl aminopeptidase [Caenispirillum bisanense]SOD94527.1 methionine aminopeptidase, type I [Caenispirillum bisanense]
MLRSGYRPDQINACGIPLHDAADIAAMRRACALAARTLDFIGGEVRAGVTTATLDALCETFMRDHGAVPATIGYRGYRHASCISVNHVVTHGIPSDRQTLRDGDILNIDVTPKLDGWHGDSSRMYVVGEATPEARRLIEATRGAMLAGIATVRPGGRMGDIGAAVLAHAQGAGGYGVVREFIGHGVGRVFHALPDVHHVARAGTGEMMEPGMIFTIEPMLTIGKPAVRILPDGWTVVTRDRSLSAQFEHTVLVTETGYEILTV